MRFPVSEARVEVPAERHVHVGSRDAQHGPAERFGVMEMSWLVDLSHIIKSDVRRAAWAAATISVLTLPTCRSSCHVRGATGLGYKYSQRLR
jgi:hypothetical protein